jgi:hypothetical protein
MFGVSGSRLTAILLILLTLTGSAGGYYWKHAHATQKITANYQTPEEADPYVRFDMEAYDSIMKNYWQKPTEEGLAQFFQLSLQKAANISTSTMSSSNRTGVAKMLAAQFKTMTSSDSKKQLAQDILKIVLYNLPPVGRDELLSTQQETELRQTVSNVNPTKDLYRDVGSETGAAIAAVQNAYQKKIQEIQHSTSTDKAAQLDKVAYAHDVLTNPQAKNRYDTNKVEPTIFSRTIGTTLYIYISKMSPTTLDEFKSVIDIASSTPGLESMIIDVRGNIGGSLEDAANILGLFIGQNQYAFDLFHQGDYQVIRTPLQKSDALARYHDVAIVTDRMSQSTAEVITAAFKKFHLAHVVGEPTRGWGTVENIFPLQSIIDASSTYSLLLVQSVTLRDDNQPIEGRGVSPDVDITKAGWQSQLPAFFRSPSIISAIKNTAGQPPLK